MALSILIVDDNASFLEASSALLERQGLSVVAIASTVAEALAQTDRFGPDVVLVDITLGRESGFELTRRLINDGRGKWPVVILISTHLESDFADLIAASPASGFLPKSELSAKAIRAILERQ